MSGFTKYEKILVLLFLLTLPLSNPWVRGDGVGYYAFARSMLIERRLDFRKDWLNANLSFRMGRTDADGQIDSGQFTATGHLDNHFSVGPALLWAPFLIVTHIGVLVGDRLGAHIPADGYSRPYVVAMAMGTALYGFLALFISFRITRRYVPERWAFLATLGIWLASSLPVYMYFNPSWSHAHSAFVVALFVWYWMDTREVRTWAQWVVLGAIGGLMMDVYFINAILLLLPLLESLADYWAGLHAASNEPVERLFAKNVTFAAVVLLAFVPTLVTKKIIYGAYLNFGYTERWFWRSPAFFKVCFSADHGLFSWTPILVLGVAGLFALRKLDRALSAYLCFAFVGYVYAIGCYQDWDGLSSFGNRFFVSLTALFVLGLGVLLDKLCRALQERYAGILAYGVATIFVLWNLGLVFQWGTHLVPARGPINWRDAAYNQVAVVPVQASQTLRGYLTQRKNLMDRIEQGDIRQRQQQLGNGADRE